MSLFRAQRLSEYALYDNDPNLFNTELDRYLDVTAARIKESVARHMDTDNCAVLDIVPAAASAGLAPAASAQPPIDARQPAAPPPQLPSKPATTDEEPATPLRPAAPHPEQPEQPADMPGQNDPGAL
jgi:hypothetical protein